MSNQYNNRKKLDLDEKIAIIVAFGVIGSILAWVLLKDNQLINATLFSPSPQTTSSVEPVTNPELEVSPVEQPSRRMPTKERKTVVIAPPVVVTELTPQPTPLPSVIVTELTPQPIPLPDEPSVIVPEPTPEPEVVFVDVAQDYWAYPFIMALAEEGIFKDLRGGNFRPNDSVPRGEYAEILNEAIRLTSTETAIDFKDVDEESEAKEAIDLAVGEKFLKGYPGEIFEPNQPISKMQVLLSLVSGLELQPSGDPETILADNYQDWQEIPEYARSAIAAATESGLVINYPDLKILNPNGEATRAQVAAMIHQALVVLEQQSPVESEYIVNPEVNQ
ncbi:MAG: hypothetical protein EA365_12415 [Gloeocapsa sp. DLM2.Bin57]|nr:MAG: hypothetical protein EA365_12415 [Gloeocapsa sp. DLM2.Bin57]